MLLVQSCLGPRPNMQHQRMGNMRNMARWQHQRIHTFPPTCRGRWKSSLGETIELASCAQDSGGSPVWLALSTEMHDIRLCSQCTLALGASMTHMRLNLPALCAHLRTLHMSEYYIVAHPLEHHTEAAEKHAAVFASSTSVCGLNGNVV